MPTSLLDLLPSELAERLREMGEPAYRARQILDWVYRELTFDYDRMTNLPRRLRDRLAAELPILPLSVRAEVASDEGQTRKVLLRLSAGSGVEAVLMVYPARPSPQPSPGGGSEASSLSHWGRARVRATARGESPDEEANPSAALGSARGRTRRTVCVSSQVGCGVGCPFCATGRSGLLRNLSAGEIVGQILHFARDVREREGAEARLTNVVFMGQGEPLANFRQVWKAVEILNSPDAFGLGARHVTISTSGLVPRILELAERPLQVGLAISLHAPDDELRDRLVPVNRKYPIAELMDACRYYVEKTNRRVSFEYVMIDGVNDSREQAEMLASLLRGFLGHVNLIPMNPVAESEFQPTPWKRVLAFESALQRRGIPCTVRVERGDPIDAACGQLRARLLETSGS